MIAWAPLSDIRKGFKFDSLKLRIFTSIAKCPHSTKNITASLLMLSDFIVAFILFWNFTDVSIPLCSHAFLIYSKCLSDVFIFLLNIFSWYCEKYSLCIGITSSYFSFYILGADACGSTNILSTLSMKINNLINHYVWY